MSSMWCRLSLLKSFPKVVKSKSFSKFTTVYSNKAPTNNDIEIEKPPTDKYIQSGKTLIYTFNHIREVRLFNRMKIYQTVLSVVTGLSTNILYILDYTDMFSVLVLNGAMIFALGMMVLIAKQSTKCIGAIYMEKDEKTIVVSHLDFFGKRRDFEVDVNKVLPLDSIDQLKEFSVYFEIEEMNGKMWLFLKHGKIIDTKKFLQIFKLNNI
jgi:hypothetical protein